MPVIGGATTSRLDFLRCTDFGGVRPLPSEKQIYEMDLFLYPKLLTVPASQRQVSERFPTLVIFNNYP